MSSQKVRNSNFAVDKDDIFKNDHLQRKEEVENLSNLIENVETPCVMTLTGDWGSGKTSFIGLWKAYLKKEKNIDSIYFDAWENDFIEDPFIAFMGEIDGFINVENDLWEKTKNVSKGLLKTSVVAGTKIVTFGALDLEKETEKVLSDLSGESVNTIISEYQTTKNEIKLFRESLEEFLQTLKKPLIIFIDELDRCKPSYTVKLLERIKHLFNVEGLIFVLSMDREQLLESIRHEYGSGIDSQKYLRKFVDFDYSLQETSRKKFISVLFDKFKIQQRVFDEVEFLIENYELSFRDIERLCTRITLVFKTDSKEIDTNHIILIVFLIFMRENNKKLYFKYFKEPSSIDDIRDFILKKGSNRTKDIEHFNFIEALLLKYKNQPTSNGKITEIIKDLSRGHKYSLDFFKNKIEFGYKFNI